MQRTCRQQGTRELRGKYATPPPVGPLYHTGQGVPAPLCYAPAGDTVCRANVLFVIRKLSARVLLEGDGGGEPLTITGGVRYVGQLGSVVAGGDRFMGMLLEALDRDDRQSIRYCADHSLLISAFWLVALLGGLMAF